MNDGTNMSAEPQRSQPFINVARQNKDKSPYQEGELALPQSFVLESGESLHDARLAWQCVGPANAPLIVVLGGISAHRRVCDAQGKGWWESQCGDGRVLDSNRYRLLGIDWLGGCDRSTGPRDVDGAFPAISTGDQARALLLLLNRLGVRRVQLLVGASYGGLVAQQLAALLGDRLHGLVLLSAAHRPSQFGIALRHIQREILELAGEGASKQALALARSLAVLGYRTPEGIEARFGDVESSDAESLNCESKIGVVPWLEHHGQRFVQRFDQDAYRCLGASLDTHHIDPRTLRVPTTVFAVREDLIVPTSLLRELVETIAGPCQHVEISSSFGHDAFLKEEGVVAGLLRDALVRSESFNRNSQVTA